MFSEIISEKLLSNNQIRTEEKHSFDEGFEYVQVVYSPPGVDPLDGLVTRANRLYALIKDYEAKDYYDGIKEGKDIASLNSELRFHTPKQLLPQLLYAFSHTDSLSAMMNIAAFIKANISDLSLDAVVTSEVKADIHAKKDSLLAIKTNWDQIKNIDIKF